MSDFFHGWRRKAGSVTLLVAAVFVGTWIRSLMFDEGLVKDESGVISAQGSVEWFKVTKLGGRNRQGPLQWFCDRHRFGDGLQMASTELIWRRQWGGFKFSASHFIDHSGVPTALSETWVAPYWSISIPLIVLSAYLILCSGKRKPRPETSSTA